MKYYRFPENRITKIGFAAFLFAILMLCRDTLVTSSIIGFYKATFISYGIIALVGIAFLWVNCNNLKEILLDERMLLLLAATVIFLVPMLVKQDWQLLYISTLICAYFSIFLTFFTSMTEVAKKYIVIISFLGVYSLIANYYLNGVLIKNSIEVPTFSNGIHIFRNYGLCFYAVDHSQYYRNFGIFREPGVYQFFVILALVLNNYLVSWRKKWEMWMVNAVLALTMLSTFATGGMIELGLLTAVIVFDKALYRDKRVCYIFAVLVVTFLAFCGYSFIERNTFYWAVYDMVSKLFHFNVSSSGGVRVQSIIVDLMIFLNNPIFGEKLKNVMFAEGLEFNTTSTMILFAAYGIIVGCFHVLSWVALLWDKNRKVWVNLSLLLIMFMSFNTQDLTANIFFWLFPVMAMVEKGIPFIKSLRIKEKA